MKELCEGGYHPEVFSASAIALARITSVDDATAIEFLEGLLPDLDEGDRTTLESVLDGHLLPSRSVQGQS